MKKILTIFLMSVAGFLFGLQAAEAQTGNDFPLDIVWNTNTYVPAGSGVKALPVPGSIINISAITPTRNSATLNYSWIVDDSSHLGQGPAQQGIGQNTFTVFARPGIPGFVHEVRVITQNPATGAEATAKVEIPIYRPEAHLYFNQGPHARRISNRFVATPGAQGAIFAKPFYFNVQDMNRLLFSWFFNGQETPSGNPQSSLDISVSESSATGIEQTLMLRVGNSGNELENSQARTSLLVVPAQ